MGWGKVKEQKLADCQNTCEECGTFFKNKRYLVLHHIQNRFNGGNFTYENARLRCRNCEIILHWLYKDGNKPISITMDQLRFLNRQ